ncbi:hypothetical protein ACIQFZ_21350 [Streptomyces sp. NPDC093064]|uniref:hypothetical protein n=1 Tax=Streptomyces sp. NPDC093064 TaxID=3366020 RepID=UPI00382EE5A4
MRELQADAAAAGRSRAAEDNERLAVAVEHIITRITDQEHDELSPAPNAQEAPSALGRRTGPMGRDQAVLPRWFTGPERWCC